MEAIAMEVTSSHHATPPPSSSSSMSLVEQQSPLAAPLDVDSKQRRHCNGEMSTPDQLPFSLQPDLLHHILTSYGLESQHLASFEASSSDASSS